MKKRWIKIGAVIALVLLCAIPLGAKYYDIYGTNALIKGDADILGNLAVTGTITCSTSNGVTAANTRSFELPLGAAIVDSATPVAVDGTTAPGTAEVDNLAALVWTSPEVNTVAWTFRLPSDYSSGLSFRALVSASSNTQAYDWQLWVNKDATIFDATAFGQDLVHQATSYPTTSNEVITFSPDATAIADIAAGNLVTFEMWRYNDGDYGAGNAEVKSVTVLYSASR